MKQQTQESLGISDETMESMIKFFLKTGIPRLIEEKKREQKGQVQNV